MYYGLPEFSARLYARLPESLHYRGEPTAWVRMTRPGQHLHSFLEGLTIADDGSMYLADVPHGRIFRVSENGKEWDAVVQYDGEPHGLWWQSSGHLLVTDYQLGLRRLDLATGTFDTLCVRADAEDFLGLSDLTQDADGNIWFTDSGRSSLSNPSGRLFKRTPSGTLTCVLDRLPYPNGVAISADGVHVLVALTRANAVWKLPRSAPEPGTPMLGSYIQLSGGLGPDGLAVSRSGLLAVAHAQAGCVWLFDTLGFPLARIVTPAGLWTTSVRFGDDGSLYIVDAQSGSLSCFDLSQLEKSHL